MEWSIYIVGKHLLPVGKYHDLGNRKATGKQVTWNNESYKKIRLPKKLKEAWSTYPWHHNRYKSAKRRIIRILMHQDVKQEVRNPCRIMLPCMILDIMSIPIFIKLRPLIYQAVPHLPREEVYHGRQRLSHQTERNLKDGITRYLSRVAPVTAKLTRQYN